MGKTLIYILKTVDTKIWFHCFFNQCLQGFLVDITQKTCYSFLCSITTEEEGNMKKLIVSDEKHLAIIKIGNGLGIKPATIEKNLEKYLPDAIAQKIYFGLAVDYRLHVQDCARMLEVISCPNRLRDGDDEWVSVGENLVANKADKIRNELIIALELNGQTAREFDGLEINKSTAVALVIVFGDSAESLISDLYGYLEDIRELFFMPDAAIDRNVLRQAVLALVRCAWADLDRGVSISYLGTDYVERIREMDFTERKEMYQNITWEDLRERYKL